MKIDYRLTPKRLLPKFHRLFELSAAKILSLEKTWSPAKGTPVFTAEGKYTSRGWTEWTQGFQFGSALLQFDATGERQFLELGREKTVELMDTHVSLMREAKIPFNEHEQNFYELALKVSGAVRAARWTQTAPGQGYIYSFNGPHP